MIFVRTQIESGDLGQTEALMAAVEQRVLALRKQPGFGGVRVDYGGDLTDTVYARGCAATTKSAGVAPMQEPPWSRPMTCVLAAVVLLPAWLSRGGLRAPKSELDWTQERAEDTVGRMIPLVLTVRRARLIAVFLAVLGLLGLAQAATASPMPHPALHAAGAAAGLAGGQASQTFAADDLATPDLQPRAEPADEPAGADCGVGPTTLALPEALRAQRLAWTLPEPASHPAGTTRGPQRSADFWLPPVRAPPRQ